MKKKIVYIGNFSFPKVNSAGVRVLNNGYLLRELGYDVVYIGVSKSVDDLHDVNKSDKLYDGFKYYELPYPSSLKDWLFFYNRLKIVITILKNLDPKFVIAYGSMSNAFFTLFLSKWCKANEIKFLVDCVDWLVSASGGTLFKIGKWLDTEIQKRYVNRISNGVIAISKYLAEYYSSKSCKTMILPPLAGRNVLNSYQNKIDRKKKISIIYAGFPFPVERKVKDKSYFKDRLDKAIELLAQQNSESFIFDIYGVSLSDYLKNVPEHEQLLSTLSGVINFHGVVNNDVVIENVSKADYFFLFRDSNKMTNAGFPSKIVEAISLGIPVITTPTSDIDNYIKSDFNGYILPLDDHEKGVLKFSEILANHAKKYPKLKESCVRDNPFDFSKFTQDTKDFLDSV